MTETATRRLARRTLLTASAATVAVGAAASIASRPANAQAPSAQAGKLREVLARGHLIVGTGSDIPPYFYKDESGNLAGFEIDLARYLAKSLFNDPTKVEFVVGNGDSRIPNVLSSRVDVVIQNMTVTPGRAQQIEFTIPYQRAGEGLLMLKAGKYKDYAQLKAAGSTVTVSAIQNVMIADWVHAALPGAAVEQFQNSDAAVQALNAGRADAHIIDHGKVRWAVTQFPEKYADSGYTWMPNSIAAGVKPGEPQWLNWLNTTLREALTGVDFQEMAGLYRRWLGIELPMPKTGYPRELIPA
jgi:polar amino acid transport system substrate-binding protein